MSDRVFFSLAALLAILMIALAAVTPQGLGARSPGVFGHALVQTPQQRSPAPLARAAAALAKLRPRR